MTIISKPCAHAARNAFTRQNVRVFMQAHMQPKPHKPNASSKFNEFNMSSESFKYVVVGGGNASGYAAKEFVANGLAPGDLCIITDEAVVAYERPALSKGFLLGVAKLPGFHTCVGGGGERQDPSWYESKGITYKTSTKVTAVDAATKAVTLSTGGTVKYEKLIVATGARPVYLTDFKTPGADLNGVHYLRDEAQGQELLKAIADTKASGGNAVVIGGGYIGMEVVAGLAGNGIPTTIVFPEDRLLSRLLTPELAKFYEGFYGEKGIKMVKGSVVTEVKGQDGKVVGAIAKKLSDNSLSELPCSLVVVGVGARPNVELVSGQVELAAAPVGGVKVNSFFQTSNPDVYAVGDVAAFPLLREGGKLVRQEHVTHCRSSAAQAVQHILGKTSTPYDYLPYFYSRVFSLSWQFWGSQGDANTQVVHFKTPSGQPGAYWVADNKVIGVFLETATADEVAAAKKLALDQPVCPAGDLSDLGITFATSRM